MTVRVSCLLAALLAACGGDSTHVVDVTARDHEIQREIKIQFNNDPRLTGLWPKCVGGVVTLEGTVNSRPVAEEAERIAKGVSGVRQVVNRIQVREK